MQKEVFSIVAKWRLTKKVTTLPAFKRSDQNLNSFTLVMRCLLTEKLELSGRSFYLKMVQNIRASGSKTLILEMVEVSRFGLTVQFMKAIGKITRQMEEEDLFMLTEISMRESGCRTRHMDRVHILTQTALSTKGDG
jgi:hypothetical protein